MSDIFEKYINKAKSYNEVNVQMTKEKIRRSAFDQRKEDPSAFNSKKIELAKKINSMIIDDKIAPEKIIMEILAGVKPSMIKFVEERMDKIISESQIDDNDAA